MDAAICWVPSRFAAGRVRQREQRAGLCISKISFLYHVSVESTSYPLKKVNRSGQLLRPYTRHETS